MIKLTKTQILQIAKGQMAIFVSAYELFTIRCLAFGSSYFYVSFSRDKKTERIERKFKTQNSNPRQLP